ncbi:transposase [Novosphingobium sp.]|uniref:transposase n=1 Tax=Novosphingobium sp. TaxID=1874826 RepID=UPI0035AEA5CE
MARSGGGWRDLPESLGSCRAVHRRYDCWGEQGVIDRIFAPVTDDPGMEWLAIDAAMIRAPTLAARTRVKSSKRHSSPGSWSLAQRVRHQGTRGSRCARAAGRHCAWFCLAERNGACKWTD